MAKRKIKIGDRDFEADEISFQPDTENGGEQWSYFTLHDGSTLKVKPVLLNVIRLEGVYTPTGDPVYHVNASLVVATNSPDSLRKT
jgi:hypothetical protein